jgi:hypothetical protein
MALLGGQFGPGINDLTPAVDAPESVLGVVVVEGGVAAVLEPVRYDAAVPPVFQPFPEILRRVVDDLNQRGDGIACPSLISTGYAGGGAPPPQLRLVSEAESSAAPEPGGPV